jgi:hypothetical protein
MLQVVTTSMIITTVLNLLHFRGKNRQVSATRVDLGSTAQSPPIPASSSLEWTVSDNTGVVTHGIDVEVTHSVGR